MLVYLYDGSFEGLLTAIYESYYRKEVPHKISQYHALHNNLFATYVTITTDPIKADKVYLAIKEKISYEALRFVFYTFLAEIDEGATWIYDYLKLGWQKGKKLNLYITDERVLRIHNIVKKVAKEKHLMLGLVRFKQVTGDIYYATIEPDCNILSLIAPHFASRFSDQNWIIHDLKRNMAALYNKNTWYLRELTVEDIKFSNDEENYQELWCQYFKSATISGRANLKLQKNHMPVRYWKHLIEK